MKPTRQLYDLGQSLWLDNITRDLLSSGTLQRYIDDFCVSGLTSNPTIFQQAIDGSDTYDPAIRTKLDLGMSAESVFFDIALEDIRRAADLFRRVHYRTCGVDGWVSIEISPMLAHETQATLEAARGLHALAARPNVFIKIPGTPRGLPAIEEAIFAGVPVNVTLLFSPEQYLAAAEAWLRGIERRIAVGLRPDVASVASLFISRWDAAVAADVPVSLRNRLGIAVGQRAYRTYLAQMASPRWQRVLNAGARPQRLLMASTGTKDPEAPDTLYIRELAAPHTVNTMPEATLQAFAHHGWIGKPLGPDGGDCETVIADHVKGGIRIDELANCLQEEGAKAFMKSWQQLLAGIEAKRAELEPAR